MEIQTRPFGSYQGVDYTEIVVKNDAGDCLIFSDLGARINQWSANDTIGQPRSIVVGYDSAEQVFDLDQYYYGATVGPVAGRIKDGLWQDGDKRIQLDQNDGQNHLHGGKSGWAFRRWDYDYSIEGDEAKVVFTLVDDATDSPYPGKVQAQVTYRLTNKHEWFIHYHIVSDERTLINPTNHVYFNLNAALDRPIDNHSLYVAAERYLPITPDHLPTGEKLPVEGTPFDYRTDQVLAPWLAANYPQTLVANGGFDHAFELSQGDGVKAWLYSPTTHWSIEMYTDQPYVVIYTHNDVKQEGKIAGIPRLKHEGITLETQAAPDAIHHEYFGKVVYEPGEVYESTTCYRLFRNVKVLEGE